MAAGGTELLIILLFVVLPIAALIIFPTLRKINGFIFIIIGILLSLTGIGAIIGVPLIIIGAILYFTGKKKEIIAPGYQHQQQTVNINGQAPATTKVQVRCSACKQLNEEYASFCQKCGGKLT